MSFYIDTSGLVKRYIKENGSDFVNDLFDFTSKRGERLYTASHTLTEFGSAVMRLSREGVLTNQ